MARSFEAPEVQGIGNQKGISFPSPKGSVFSIFPNDYGRKNKSATAVMEDLAKVIANGDRVAAKFIQKLFNKKSPLVNNLTAMLARWRSKSR